MYYKHKTGADPRICVSGPDTALPSSPVPFFFLLSLPLSSLEVGPLNQLEGLGERCKLPQQGSEHSPGRKRI